MPKTGIQDLEESNALDQVSGEEILRIAKHNYDELLSCGRESTTPSIHIQSIRSIVMIKVGTNVKSKIHESQWSCGNLRTNQQLCCHHDRQFD